MPHNFDQRLNKSVWRLDCESHMYRTKHEQGGEGGSFVGMVSTDVLGSTSAWDMFEITDNLKTESRAKNVMRSGCLPL
jgi:hypothetical protein